MHDGFGETERQRLGLLAGQWRTEAATYPAGRFAGRGIVICAGGARVFTNAYVLIRVLRETLGSKLPIELWHFGAAEISPAMATILRDLDVDLIDAVPLVAERAPAIRDGWQLKSFALLWSRFAQVLLLDADQVPERDPAALFDWPEFHDTGAIFWPDAVDLRADNPVWGALGLDPRQRISIESGQLLVDKSRHWAALTTALRLNEEADLLYRVIYGDKDTFLLAWLLRGAACSLVPHRPFVDEHVMVQRDFSGHRLFQHRTNAKWAYAGEQARFPGFVHEAACLGFIDDLRKLWGGRVFNAPERSSDAIEQEAALAGEGRFVLEIGSSAPEPLELRHHGEIGAGRSYDRQNWWVETSEAGLHLVISDGSSRTYGLHQKERGYWLGATLTEPQTHVMLKPASSRPISSAGDDRSAAPDRSDAALHRGYVRSQDGARR